MREYKPLARRGNRKNSPSSSFSLQVQNKVLIELEDSVKKTLNEINISLKLLTNQNNYPSQTISEPLFSSVNPQEDDEPRELSINLQEELKEAEKKYGTIVYANEIPDNWNHIEEFKALKWREEDGKFNLNYHKSSVLVTRGQLKKLLEIPKKERIHKIVKIPGVGFSNNKKTAVSLFCQCVEKGIVTLPEEDHNAELESNFNSFLDNVDPDLPMLIGLNLTQIKGDCGNGEEAC